MAGIRFPGTVLMNGWLDSGGATGGWSPTVSSTAWIASMLEQARIYVSPARYSQVRKVTFAITFQHIQNGGTLATTFRARIGPPGDTSNLVRSVPAESVIIATGDRPITVGAGQVWNNSGPDHDDAFYPLTGTENAVAPRQVASPRATTDAQICTVTFERFKDAEFFADWDAITALGDDEYIAYAAGIQRDDGGTFTGALGDADRVPQVIGFQMIVVQAPSVQNDSCTHFNGTNGLFPDENFNAPNRVAKMIPFTYRAADWDGLQSVHIFARQTSRSGAITNGAFTIQVNEISDNGSYPGTTVFSEAFTPGVTNITLAARTANLLSFLEEGKTYTISFTSQSGSGAQDLPWACWEFIQKDFTRKSSYHIAGQGNPTQPTTIVPDPPTTIGDYRYSVDQCIFDPAWFDNLEDARILQRRWFAGLDHTLPNDTDLLMVLNPSLTADIPNSGANLISDETSSTPDADTGLRIRGGAISRTDPLNLGGLRVMKLRMNRTDWNSGATDDTVGGVGYQYVFTVPNSEFPELGPLFSIGEFNPEGCASTAAGLGDSPALLIITNGSTVPKKFNPTAMNIENAGLPVPYRGEEPSGTTASVALSPEGGLTPGIYTYRYTLRNCCTGKEGDPNPVDIVVDGSGESPGLEVTLSFAGVVIPADPQVCEICIYRTILGGDFPVMAKVGCFDPNVTTIFVDILPDTELDFVNDSLFILNAPMPCVAVVVEFRNRLFGLVDIPDLDPPGTVSVTTDSDELEGDPDTEFDRCVIGKFIQIEGDCTAYEVIECLAPVASSPEGGMRLKLERPYEGVTDSGLNYIICGHPNRLYISEPLEPECWPGINFLDVDPGDGDRLMGAVSNFNRLVIFKRRKTYVVAFREQPITEIVVPTLISKDIGCIAPRSVAQVSSGSVWLSDRGLALYDGRGVGPIPESSVMNDLFVNSDNPNYLRRDANGRAIGAAGVFYPKREQYLLLLPTVKTNRGASMILVWDTMLRNVTLLEFCQEFLSIEVAKDADGNERVYLGDTNGFVWIWDVGDTDGAGFPNATGTVRGTITAVGIDPLTGASFLEDSTASFFAGGVPGIADLSGLAGTSGLTGLSNMGLAGACVFWRRADAELGTPWQSRFIYVSTMTKLFVTPNWGDDTPGVGDEYMIGPIRFEAEFKPANYGTDDFTKRDWRQVIVHEPEQVATDLRTELLRDFQNSDVDEDTVTDAAGVAGLGRTFDLGFGQGRQIRPVGRLVHNFMGVRLTNFAPEEPLTILNHLLMLVPRQSK